MGKHFATHDELSSTIPSYLPRWTPDGAHITFGVAPTRDEGDFPHAMIYVASSDGSAVLSLSESMDKDAIFHSPNISPDGSTIAYSSYQKGELGEFSGTFDIETSALDGTSRRKLTEGAGLDYSPVWSPDGSRIAFQRHGFDEPCSKGSDGSSGAFVMDADGSNVRPLLVLNDDELPSQVRPKIVSRLAWSPDGKFLAYLIEKIDDKIVGLPKQTFLEIVLADASERISLLAGRKRMRVRFHPEPLDDFMSSPEWSPDGRFLAFLKKDDEDRPKLYAIDRDGSGLREVADRAVDLNGADVVSYSGNVSWFPDGSRILFDIGHTAQGVQALYVVDADGSDLRVVASDASHAALSPDGSKVAVALPEGAQVMLFTTALDGSDTKLLVRRGEDGLLEAMSSEPQGNKPIDILPCRLGSPHCLQVFSGRLASGNPCGGGFVAPDPESNSDLVQDCETVWELGRWAVEIRQPGRHQQPSWDGLTPMSEWEGVVVGDTSTGLRVVELSLKRWELIGPISGRLTAELGKLTALESLDLSYNELSDPIAPELGNLPNLQRLNRSYNRLNGCIPEGLHGKVHGYQNPENCDE